MERGQTSMPGQVHRAHVRNHLALRVIELDKNAAGKRGDLGIWDEMRVQTSSASGGSGPPPQEGEKRPSTPGACSCCGPTGAFCTTDFDCCSLICNVSAQTCQ